MAESMENQGSYNEKPEFTELDWITLKKDINSAQLEVQESASDKFKRKFFENPLVPIGCGATGTVLALGLYAFTKGDRKTSQHMMRWRVVAQGFTIFALMAGIVKTQVMK